MGQIPSKLSKKLNLKKIFQRSTQNMTTFDPAPNTGINRSGYFTSYTFGQLQRATRNFATDSIIGQGGFGNVYVGDKESIKPIAVKDMRSKHEFLAEIRALCVIIHPNIISLFGYCSEGDRRLLVYEYAPRGSLYSYMHDPTEGPLDWITRMKIALGIARALEFLHQRCDPRVIFRDVKSRNVLLVEDFNPKLADFCASDDLPQEHKGAPECAAGNGPTNMVDVDVYAFGVIMLELVTGRKAVDQNVLLVDWVQTKLRNGSGFDSISDERLNGVYPRERFARFVRMALRCTKKDPGDRPSMDMVVLFIENLDNRIENAPAIDMEFPVTWVQGRNGGRKGWGAHRREASV